MIGIDIIVVARFSRIGASDYTHWSKFFTRDEWEYCFAKANPAQSLAGIYAAKEAVMKAVGGELMGRADRIEIVHTREGAPFVRIDKKDEPGVHVSISHTNDIAVAVAIKHE